MPPLEYCTQPLVAVVPAHTSGGGRLGDGGGGLGGGSGGGKGEGGGGDGGGGEGEGGGGGGKGEGGGDGVSEGGEAGGCDCPERSGDPIGRLPKARSTGSHCGEQATPPTELTVSRAGDRGNAAAPTRSGTQREASHMRPARLMRRATCVWCRSCQLVLSHALPPS